MIALHETMDTAKLCKQEVISPIKAAEYSQTPNCIETLPATVMAQLSQACNCMIAQDTSSYSELVTGVDSYTRELQEKSELVTGIRYAHIIRCNQVSS